MSGPRKPRKTQLKRRKSDSILHRDIKDLEIGKSLRKLGNIRVTEWELSDVLPAVNRLASKEVDVIDLIKRTANYRVTDWELKDLMRKRRGRQTAIAQESMDTLARALTGFVRLMAASLTDGGDLARLSTRFPVPGFLMIQLVLPRRDAAALIGHGGHTAAAIRAVLRDVAGRHGARVGLRILAEEELPKHGGGI